MRNQGLFLKPTKYTLFVVIIGFIFLGGLIYHINITQATLLNHSLTQNNQTSPQDFHNFSDSCYYQKEILANSQSRDENNQKFISISKNYIGTEKLSSLTRQDGNSFNSLEYLPDPQTIQFFTVVTKE
ncbi:MAG TPA: hypothetical protein ENI19_01725 [Candidatus Nealsonbacteria bacterium]|uniref:Uncharacterized protein n=1 Tax=marine sediment metagenome TaxID=412755 RepID=A0A0F9X3V6_9ZZZZ|nr:hypothetical protein [Candidatus Nealsonbacteria bacterium]HEB46410.1 hypothetical protein [Candidatus Nealsonbacteria bacterium]